MEERRNIVQETSNKILQIQENVEEIKDSLDFISGLNTVLNSFIQRVEQLEDKLLKMGVEKKNKNKRKPHLIEFRFPIDYFLFILYFVGRR